MSQNEIKEKLREKVYAMRLKNIAEATNIPADVISKFMRLDDKELWPEHLQRLEKYLEAH